MHSRAKDTCARTPLARVSLRRIIAFIGAWTRPFPVSVRKDTWGHTNIRPPSHTHTHTHTGPANGSHSQSLMNSAVLKAAYVEKCTEFCGVFLCAHVSVC